MNPAHLLQVSGTDFLFSSSSHLRPSEIWKYRTGTDLFTFWTTCFDIFFVTLQQTEHVPLRQVYAVTLLTNQKEVFFSFWHHEMTTERPGVRVDPPCSLEVVGVCPVYLNSYSTSYYWLIIPLLKSWKCLSSITLNKFTRLLHFFSTPLTSKRLAAYRWSFVTVCFNNLWTVKKKKKNTSDFSCVSRGWNFRFEVYDGRKYIFCLFSADVRCSLHVLWELLSPRVM